MHHAGQECRFVLKVADAETLQASNSTPPNAVCAASTASIGLPLQLRIVSSRQTELTDIGDNYERASEDTFIASLCTFD